MKVEKDKIPNNLFNHNKNFIPKPRPLSKRDNKMNLLLFNRHHKNNVIKISEKEQIEINKQKIKFIKKEKNTYKIKAENPPKKEKISFAKIYQYK